MDKRQRLEALYGQWYACARCNLCQTRNNVVFGYGNPDSKVMIIGEAPGANEDKQGVPFVGQSGMLQDHFLAQVSAREDVKRVYGDGKFDPVELRSYLLQDYFYTNVAACRPPENRPPTPTEVKACMPRVQELIYIIDPLLIVAVGRISIEALMGKKVAITSSHGEMFDLELPGRLATLHYPVVAVLHPAFLLRSNDARSEHGSWKQTFDDWMHIMHLLDELNARHFDIPKPKRG